MRLDNLRAVVWFPLGLVLQTADAVDLIPVSFHVPLVFRVVTAHLGAVGFLASARGLIEFGSALAAVCRGGGHGVPFCV